ncbi:hypothetical protein HAX54_049446 [Datura stramonium]|uniref:Putative plant transposon protein domain-containing protein n=1 Tax=Datura stramonium TaxID=4076 RepID=A0ABS8WMK3_DATST|nr:hypothetical protein [Datura stramonium]
MREIYVVGLEMMTQGNVKWSIFEEVQICSSDLSGLPKIKDLFDHYKLDWMSEPPGEYSQAMVREFYAAYVAILNKTRKKGDSEKGQPPLDSVEQAWINDIIVTITKGSLSTAAKFWCTVVRLRLVPTQADNQLTLDWVILIASFMSRFTVNLSWIIVAEIRERVMRSQPSTSAGSLFLDFLEDSTPGDMPTRTGDGAAPLA